MRGFLLVMALGGCSNVLGIEDLRAAEPDGDGLPDDAADAAPDALTGPGIHGIAWNYTSAGLAREPAPNTVVSGSVNGIGVETEADGEGRYALRLSATGDLRDHVARQPSGSIGPSSRHMYFPDIQVSDPPTPLDSFLMPESTVAMVRMAVKQPAGTIMVVLVRRADGPQAELAVSVSDAVVCTSDDTGAASACASEHAATGPNGIAWVFGATGAFALRVAGAEYPIDIIDLGQIYFVTISL